MAVDKYSQQVAMLASWPGGNVKIRFYGWITAGYTAETDSSLTCYLSHYPTTGSLRLTTDKPPLCGTIISPMKLTKVMAIGKTIGVFFRWFDKGHAEKLLEQCMVEPDLEWLMIDASHLKIHPHAAVAKGGNEAICPTTASAIPRYILLWIRMICWSELLLLRVLLRIALRQKP